MTDLQAAEWVIEWASSVPLKTENHRGAQEADWRRRAAMRLEASQHFRAARLPKTLVRPRIEFRFHFPTDRGRDNPNLGILGKPLLDALGPDKTRTQKRKTGLKVINAPGIGLIPDDQAAFLHCEDCPHNRMSVLDPAEALRAPYGRITVTITLRQESSC